MERGSQAIWCLVPLFTGPRVFGSEAGKIKKVVVHIQSCRRVGSICWSRASRDLVIPEHRNRSASAGQGPSFDGLQVGVGGAGTRSKKRQRKLL